MGGACLERIDATTTQTISVTLQMLIWIIACALARSTTAKIMMGKSVCVYVRVKIHIAAQ